MVVRDYFVSVWGIATNQNGSKLINSITISTIFGEPNHSVSYTTKTCSLAGIHIQWCASLVWSIWASGAMWTNFHLKQFLSLSLTDIHSLNHNLICTKDFSALHSTTFIISTSTSTMVCVVHKYNDMYFTYYCCSCSEWHDMFMYCTTKTIQVENTWTNDKRNCWIDANWIPKNKITSHMRCGVCYYYCSKKMKKMKKTKVPGQVIVNVAHVVELGWFVVPSSASKLLLLLLF